MALRSPTAFHSYWGAFATGSLPSSSDVQVGDTAYDTTLGLPVVCSSIGPVVWSTAVGPTGPTGPTGPGAYSIAQTNSGTNYPHTTWEVFGADPYTIDPDPLKTRTFRCVAAAPLGFTTEVRLTDLSAPNGAQLCSVTTNSTTPVALSVTFIPTDGTRRIYAVEVRVSGGSPSVSQRGYCYGSTIEVT